MIRIRPPRPRTRLSTVPLACLLGLVAVIRQSDNDAAFTLWRSVGGASALDAANAELGLVKTTADADTWGLDTTTVGHPRNTTGLWVVNSIGRITRDGHELLVAVLSDGHTSMAAGVSKVEAAAEAAAETLNSATE